MPAPSEVQQWIDKQKLINGDDDHIQVNMHLQEKCVALWRMMYRQVHAARQTAEIELKHRDAIIEDLRSSSPPRDQPVPKETFGGKEYTILDAIEEKRKLQAEVMSIQTRLSSTEVERDSLRQTLNSVEQKLKELTDWVHSHI